MNAELWIESLPQEKLKRHSPSSCNSKTGVFNRLCQYVYTPFNSAQAAEQAHVSWLPIKYYIRYNKVLPRQRFHFLYYSSNKPMFLCCLFKDTSLLKLPAETFSRFCAQLICCLLRIFLHIFDYHWFIICPLVRVTVM